MYRIGAFSKITSLTVKALRYYDEQGLLRPSARDESGYRLYSEEDYQTARRIALLRRFGFVTAAMALRDDSLSIADPRLLAPERLAIVLGTEGDGLASATIDGCDYTVMIPMAHGVDSLNVAAASAVAFWELSRH